MDHQAINHLLALLASDGNVVDPAFLNNLVYYTPRLKSSTKLVSLVKAIFKSNVWLHFDLLKLYQMAQGIVYWKLEISEPSIPVSVFYDVWNSCFAKCQLWTMPRLAIIGGILSTKDKFNELQLTSFVDDTGKIKGYYRDWKRLYYLPILQQFLQMPYTDLRSLTIIYATISEFEDSSINNLDSWCTITSSLADLFSSYIISPHHQDIFLHENMNKLAKTLQISLTKSPDFLISRFLSRLCRDFYDLSVMELKTNPNKDYSSKRYSNILFTTCVALKALLEDKRSLPPAWYYQITMCLFYLNFITEDIGNTGLDSYGTVYEITSTAISCGTDSRIYYDLLSTMKGNISHIISEPSKINTSRLLFMLNFMGTTLSEVPVITPQLIQEIVLPLRLTYLNSTSLDIRESVHVAMISLFMNSNKGLAKWQAQNYLNYLRISVGQFLDGKITEQQIILIFQKISSRVSSLSFFEKHLLRDALHYTYTKVLNCYKFQKEQQKALVKCIIYQIPYVVSQKMIYWLDTVQELLSQINFTATQRDDILSSLWKTVSTLKSDTALKWWYSTVVPMHARL